MEIKKEYERLTLNERVQHFVLLFSFIVLAISGFMVEIPASWISALRLDYPTLFEIRGLIHRIAAVILILDSLYHLGYLGLTLRGRWQLRELLPRKKDLFDLIQVVKHYRNPNEPMPKFDWFNYKEKAEYWALVWGNIVMPVTGAMLWFEQYTPKLFLDIAAVVHTYEALLAVLAIIVWHFYNAHLNPEVFPMSRIWLQGTISEEELLAHHPLAYEKVTTRVMREAELPEIAKRKWSKIFALTAVAFIALIFIAYATSVELISHQRFCRSCHVMEPYYDSWANSTHKKVSCGECHNLPGFSGFVKSRYKSMAEITKHIIGNYRSELHAEVDDIGCLKHNCHDKQTIKDIPEAYSKRKVAFSHKAHLIKPRRGKWLKCISCHSQVVQGAHMNVTQSTCFLCHFKATPEYRPISGCPSCHSAPEQLVIHEGVEINHKKLLAFNIECRRCHIHLVEGDGRVEQMRCYDCHNELERLQKYDDSQLIHKNHLTGHKLNCLSCHSEIQHKEVEFTEALSTDCQSCHPNHHAAQKELYLGVGGKDVETKPDVMFLARVGCEGCHGAHKGSEVEGTTFVAKPEACINCHGEEYADMQAQWQRGLDNLIAQVQPSTELVAQELKNAERAGKNITAAQQLYQEATHNIELVRYGKGVHNVQYSDSLLTTASEKLTKALQLINPNRTIPELLKPQVKKGATCISCHFGIEAKIVEIYGEYFKHGRHLLYAKLDCTVCHSDQPKGEPEHGKLLVASSGCMQCHHKETKADCLQCHEDAKVQVVVYQGKRFDHKSHGAGEKIQCSTCHASDIKQSFKAKCAPCHHYEKEIADKISRVVGAIREMPALVYCESCHPIQTAMYKGLQLIASLRSQRRLPSMKFDVKVDCVKCHKFDAIGSMTLTKCDTEGCHKEQPPAPSPLIKGGRGVVGKGEGDYAAIMNTWQAKTKASVAQAEILEQKIEKLLADWDVPEAKQLYSNAKESLDFVRKDGSLGVHHSELVDKLMKSAIEWLQQSLQLLTREIQG